jgi:hypothetical protein
MALPVNHRFDERLIQTTAASVANGVAGVARAPCRGQITEVGTVIGAVVSTADATCTTSIAGTSITAGSFVITQAGSAVGDLDNALPTAANICNEGDAIRFAFSGTGTAGGNVYCYAVLKPI